MKVPFIFVEFMEMFKMLVVDAATKLEGPCLNAAVCRYNKNKIK